jgi:hypothetical protein
MLICVAARAPRLGVSVSESESESESGSLVRIPVSLRGPGLLFFQIVMPAKKLLAFAPLYRRLQAASVSASLRF